MSVLARIRQRFSAFRSMSPARRCTPPGSSPRRRWERRCRQILGSDFVMSAGMTSCHHGGRPFLRWTAVLALAAIALSCDVTSRTAFADPIVTDPIVINGGTSWEGWSLRGNSRDVGIWAGGSTTRDYDLYTTVFYFNNNAITGNPVQVKTVAAPSGFGQGSGVGGRDGVGRYRAKFGRSGVSHRSSGRCSPLGGARDRSVSNSRSRWVSTE